MSVLRGARTVCVRLRAFVCACASVRKGYITCSLEYERPLACLCVYEFA